MEKEPKLKLNNQQTTQSFLGKVKQREGKKTNSEVLRFNAISPCVCVFPITEGMNFSLGNNFRYMFIFKNDVYNYYPCF